MPIETHVIMCNDYPQFVYVGTERSARRKMETMNKEDSNKRVKENNVGFLHWHIKTVKNNLLTKRQSK